MKILRVAQEIYPEVVGGGAYHAHALSRDQTAMGHDVTVVSIRPEIDSRREETRDGYRVVQFPATVSPLGNDVSVSAARYLKDKVAEYDVVHAHAHFYFASNVTAVLSHLGNAPMVVTNHALISQSVPTWIAKLHLQTLGRYTFGRAEKVFTYTDDERRRLEALTSAPDVEVVSNGIDKERFSPSGPGHDRLEDDSLGVLFVGRFVEGKRPRDAIEAFAALRESGVDATLYLCGDGPLRAELERLADDLDIEDRVEFLGLVDYEEMPDVFRAADLFVLTSRSEGFPRTVMEALSTETPVVASHLDQVGPIVQRAGETVEPGDVDGFAKALRGLARDDHRREELGELGRRVLEDEGLTWQETARQTTALTEAAVE